MSDGYNSAFWATFHMSLAAFAKQFWQHVQHGRLFVGLRAQPSAFSELGAFVKMCSPGVAVYSIHCAAEGTIFSCLKYTKFSFDWGLTLGWGVQSALPDPMVVSSGQEGQGYV